MHDLFSSEMLHAGLQIDMQVLRGVVILHAERDLIIHAADRIHDRRDAVEIDDHIIVRPETHQSLDFVLGLLNASAHDIGCIDLAPCAAFTIIAHGVSRNVHNIDGLCIDIHRRDHERIRTGLVLVHRADHKGEYVVNARARVEQAVDVHFIAVFLIVDGRVVHLRRADKHRTRCRQSGDQRNNDGHRNDDPAALLLLCQLLLDLPALFPGGLGRGSRRLACRAHLLRCGRRRLALLLAARFPAVMPAAASKKFQMLFSSSAYSSRQRTPCRIISLYAAMVSLCISFPRVTSSISV